MKRSFIFWFVTCAGLGLSPMAPGTVASAVACFFWGALLSASIPLAVFVFLNILLFILGSLAIQKYERDLEVKDNSHVVIDEWVGIGITYSVVELKTLPLILGFLLFRIFDIWKPPGVRYFDRNYLSGWGVMLDDVIAGVYAAVVLFLLQKYVL